MNESKHTPRWIVMVNDLGLGHCGDIIITTQERIDKNKGPIVQDIIDRDTALEIALCRNSHDALLEACKEAQEWMQRSIKGVNRPAFLDKLLIDAIAEAKKGD